MTWLGRLLAPWLVTPRAIRDLWDFVLDESEAVTAALNRSEDYMSEIDNALSELDGATNKVADAQAALDESRAAALAALAGARIRASADKLRGLAADPANPVPADEPAADTNDESGPTPAA